MPCSKSIGHGNIGVSFPWKETLTWIMPGPLGSPNHLDNRRLQCHDEAVQDHFCI